MRMYLENGEVVLDFPYDAGQVNEIKKITGAKWDKLGKVWRLPITSMNEGRDFAMKHDFEVALDAMKFLVDKPKTASARVFLLDGSIIMRFPYERVIIKAVKQIPAVSWDSKKSAWQAPLSSVKEVINWAETFSVYVEPEVIAIADDVTEKMNEFIEASRSTDAGVQVDKLQGDLLPYHR